MVKVQTNVMWILKNTINVFYTHVLANANMIFDCLYEVELDSGVCDRKCQNS